MTDHVGNTAGSTGGRGHRASLPLTLVAVALALWVLTSAACGHSDKFVGTWKLVENGSSDQLVITKDRSVYHIDEAIWGGNMAGTMHVPTLTATLSDGQLVPPRFLPELRDFIEIRGDQLVWHRGRKIYTYTKLK